MLIEIKNRWTAAVIFSGEFGSLKLAVEAAVKIKTDLSRANLSNSNLSNSDLSGANLSRSDLSNSNLSNSDLRNSNLSNSNLRNSNLRNSDLSDSDLSGADLSDSDLSDSDLSGANLSGANLSVIRDDIFAVLSAAPSEVQFLLNSMNAGKIDGSQYRGDCCCLVGTLEKNCGKNLDHNSSRISESWFTQFKPEMTPENNPNMKITRDWIQSWLDSMKAAFSK